VVTVSVQARCWGKNNSVQVTSTEGARGTSRRITWHRRRHQQVLCALTFRKRVDCELITIQTKCTQSLSGIGFTDALPLGWWCQSECLTASAEQARCGTAGSGASADRRDAGAERLLRVLVNVTASMPRQTDSRGRDSVEGGTARRARRAYGYRALRRRGWSGWFIHFGQTATFTATVSSTAASRPGVLHGGTTILRTANSVPHSHYSDSSRRWNHTPSRPISGQFRLCGSLRRREPGVTPPLSRLFRVLVVDSNLGAGQVGFRQFTPARREPVGSGTSVAGLPTGAQCILSRPR